MCDCPRDPDPDLDPILPLGSFPCSGEASASSSTSIDPISSSQSREASAIPTPETNFPIHRNNANTCTNVSALSTLVLNSIHSYGNQFPRNMRVCFLARTRRIPSRSTRPLTLPLRARPLCLAGRNKHFPTPPRLLSPERLSRRHEPAIPAARHPHSQRRVLPPAIVATLTEVTEPKLETASAPTRQCHCNCHSRSGSGGWGKSTRNAKPSKIRLELRNPSSIKGKAPASPAWISARTRTTFRTLSLTRPIPHWLCPRVARACSPQEAAIELNV
jgi:hypothetical protein